MDLPDPDELLQEQVDYYRARAPEYDDWWFGRGRYAELNTTDGQWGAARRSLEAALDAFAPAGDVLEIAAGTGNLTTSLLRHRAVTSLTALDSSSETLAIARAKAGDDPRVTFETVDVFTWQPQRRYNVVAFGFWLSHVPPRKVPAFWELVDRALAPDGRVYFIDNAVAAERPTPSGEGDAWSPWNRTWLDQSVSLRTLSDGRQFRIVKRLWTPDEIAAELEPLGWDVAARDHLHLFISAAAQRKSTG